MTRRDWLQSSAFAGAYFALGTNGSLAQEPDDDTAVATPKHDSPTTAEDSWMAAQRPVESLLPHQLESGLVTQSEMDLAQRWVAAVGSGSRPEWLDGWLGTALPFSFRYDGVDSAEVLSRCDFDAGEWATDDSGARRSFTWTDPRTGLRIVCEVRGFAAFPAFDWVLTFENTGTQETPVLEEMKALDLRLNRTQGHSYHLYGATGARTYPDDLLPFDQQLAQYGQLSRIELGGDYPSCNGHLPFYNISTYEGRGVAIGVGWSGHWHADASVEGSELRTRMGLMNARYYLRPGERTRTPRALVLLWQGHRLHGQNVLRRLLLTHYVPPLKDVRGVDSQLMEPLVSHNVAFAYHGGGAFLHEATVEPVQALVDPFIKLGAEVFIIDSGWYEGAPWGEWMGNWTYSRDKYPNGFRSISDPLAAADVRFGIWFASEMVARQVPLVRERPDWIRQHEPGSGGTLRMEDPEARQWFLDQVEELIRNEGMTCYRQDGAGGNFTDEPNRQGIDETRHMEGVYESWDALFEMLPSILMEGCSGGGRRIDLESLSRFHWHQKSDLWFRSEDDQVALYGANLFLPGGLINLPTRGTDNYSLWSSFAGQLCLAWHPLDEEFPMDEATKQIRLYKEIRRLLSGDFYPLTPCAMDARWLGYQFHRDDLDAGFALLFRRQLVEPLLYSVSGDEEYGIVLRGLIPDRRYRVRTESRGDDTTMTGADLAETVRIKIEKAPGVEMVRYEPI